MAAVKEISEQQVARDSFSENDRKHEEENDDLFWTEEEEAALLRRVDILLMPILILGFFALQLDRGNIGNALTDGFFKDVGITQNQFNTGQQLLSLGIIVLEIPSNMILYRIGPTLWIGGQVIAWGLVATFQAFMKGYNVYVITRLLLGLCEAGFIPACLFTMSRWYKRNEISKRFSWFFMGNLVASAMTGIIAFGILRMRGIAGLSGWQWLFILEGIFTVLIGLTFLLFFPDQVTNPKSLLGLCYFNERETQILYQRVIRDDPSKKQVGTHITLEDFKSTFTNWRILPHIGFTIAGMAPPQVMGSYAPTLITSFGYSGLQSNAMVSIGYWGLLFCNLLWGWAWYVLLYSNLSISEIANHFEPSDRLGVRGPMVLLGFILGLGFNIGNKIAVTSTSAHTKFAILITSIVFSWPWHAVNGSWLSLNARTPGERSITMALHIMAANCSGIVGKALFREDDAPYYPRGFSIIVALSAVGVFLSALANLQYYFGNDRVLKRKGLRYTY
ncbi:unnamed protein product [Clonostachys rosea]|uniref:Major facilitator superfamily (MFS) profile domain-containing protein n=1 Tax=Bionectria ochroleuca TaxID=29856 RepID=A0ABY6U742_BIOOC|nr:unnamed protein product [Clonostachys rosea]